MSERVDRAAGIKQRGLRRRVGQRHARQPGAMARCPRRSLVKAHAVTQQQLGQPVAGTHQVHADRLTRTHEVAQRLLLRTRDADRVQLARQQQPDEQLGVTAIGLHAIARRTRDLARRCDHTRDIAPGELTREAVPRRPRLIGHPDRPRQSGAQPGRLVDVTAGREERELPGLGVEHRRHDLRRVHVQTDEASSLRHGWFLLCDCGSPRGSSRAARTFTPRPSWGNRPLLPRGPDGPTIHIV